MVNGRLATKFKLNSLGDMPRAQGDIGRAVILYAESLDRAKDIGAAFVAMNCLHGIALSLVTPGCPAEGARLLGADEHIRSRAGWHLDMLEQAEYEAACAAADDALGQEVFATAWDTGHGLSMEHATAEAFTVARELQDRTRR